MSTSGKRKILYVYGGSSWRNVPDVAVTQSFFVHSPSEARQDKGVRFVRRTP